MSTAPNLKSHWIRFGVTRGNNPCACATGQGLGYNLGRTQGLNGLESFDLSAQLPAVRFGARLAIFLGMMSDE